MTPVQVATRAQLDQLLAEFRDEIDAASDVEIAFMRRVARNLGELSKQAPDEVLAHAMSMCAAAVAGAIAESHDRRNDPDQEVS